MNSTDLLSFQTTFVFNAKIGKICCPAKENDCSLWQDKLFNIISES